MDIATAVGLLAGFGVITWSILMGGSVMLFIHVPSMLITVGGMLCATCIHFSMGQMLRIFGIIKKTLFYRMPDEQQLIQKMVNYSAINRRDGTLALQQQLAGAGDRFLAMALQMLIDGQSEDNIGKHLSMEIQCLQERHGDGKKMLEFMGNSAPAFGMVGTLIGLIQMLANMSSPDQIGAGMAVALITTFYGAFLANLVFIPLAGKLGIRSKQELMLREMIVQGTLNICRGENPTTVRENMQAFISAKHREELKPTV
ncbi:MAG: MotA/TolQ/ExbB proton channel family protein [Planctomycetaceae bacterium]|nr:MotA/TolQ/ExbB proton channel family protein [Planctomycetaceae bacterium]